MTFNKLKFYKLFKIIFFTGVILTMVVFWYDRYNFWFSGESVINCPKDSNVGIIKIHGRIAISLEELVSGENETKPNIVLSETVVKDLEQLKTNKKIKAIILDINSYGGSPTASEEIAKALKTIEKPTVALIKDGAFSAAYLTATAANKIYASRFSEVGDIAVTMSYLDYSAKNKKEGIIYQQLSSAKFKDTGNPDKELTEEERQLLMENIEKMHKIFVEEVAQNRNLDIQKVEKLADGSTFVSQDAKENGLIDEIGGLNEVKEYLKKELNIEPKLCFIDN